MGYEGFTVYDVRGQVHIAFELYLRYSPVFIWILAKERLQSLQVEEALLKYKQ